MSVHRQPDTMCVGGLGFDEWVISAAKCVRANYMKREGEMPHIVKCSDCAVYVLSHCLETKWNHKIAHQKYLMHAYV